MQNEFYYGNFTFHKTTLPLQTDFSQIRCNLWGSERVAPFSWYIPKVPWGKRNILW